MKTFIRTTIFALLAIFTFTSCINDDYNISTQSEEIAVNLVVSLGPSQKTRATYSDAKDAVGNEYYINVKPVQDFELLVYNTDGTLRTKAVIEDAEPLDYNTYQLKGKFYTFRENDLNQNYKFVVVANAQSGSCNIGRSIDWLATGNQANLYSQLKYEYNNAKSFTKNILEESESNEEKIPMWGCLTAKLVNGANLNIQLVRAMAKVTVSTASDLGKKIESVKLVGYNKAGMLTPMNAASNANTYEVNSENGDTEVNVPEGVSFETEELPFATYEKNDTKYYCLYIPEQTKDADSKIIVIIDGEEYELHFAKYDENHNSTNPGEKYPVLRNNWYNYVIKSVSPKGIDLSLQYYVADWNSKNPTNIEFN